MRCRLPFYVLPFLGALACHTKVAPRATSAVGADWPTYNGNLEGTRFSSLTQITAANAPRIGRACTFDTGEQMSMQSGPVVVNGVLYLTTDTSTYAIDAATCARRWQTSRSYTPLGFLKNNHGVAYMNGRLFRVNGGVHAYALDAATGKLLWDVSFGERQGEGAPMAPIAWNGLVFVGNGGGDNLGVRGHVHALDAATGREVWRFEVVPDTGAPRATWPSGGDAAPPTGGGIWSSFTLDPATGTLYVPAGNPAPDFMPHLREGANLYANSLIAIDARTGRMRDYVQVLDGRRDWHDWDVSATPALIHTRGGRALLALAGKDGLLHGVDPAPMRILWSVPTTTRENIEAPLTNASATRFCPGTQGGSEWNGPAYDPGQNLVFTGAVDWCARIRLVHPDSIPHPLPIDFTGNAGGGFGEFDPKESWKGWVTAADPDAGQIRWRYQARTPILAAVTSTAGGIVITGDMTGRLIVLDAKSGNVLREVETGAPMGGGIITYEVGGRQYIAAAGGSISPIWPLDPATSRVTVFRVQ
ncbi:MAG: PQQ-binding-like beta-propeller repeat protein [Gemmatimonadaceae bacterium]|nr:PQQ-binding-like beta-propeller repeat protein [Gemmatimonadaceae bacterium]NUQ94904.1 PQQ-binding-like beta-propeller repeat protein [Gemmatimonadaceae bacterium]NUR35256.1 PQQ-binding-like beta-propeller repeat protein [Gemmatimonadaceae bacterium]NUS97855.1 PQQ-binding-like beta-propeller repeat protein [Gemmatimonadaceae bacterium]